MEKQGNFLLLCQLGLLFLLFYLGNLKNVFNSPLLLAIFALGLLVLVVSYFNLGAKSYSPLPSPTKTNIFSQKGLYQYIRHPMYSALLILGGALVLSSGRLETFIIFVALILVLNLKADLEEELLAKRHKGYKFYAAKTKKFIPFLY